MTETKPQIPQIKVFHSRSGSSSCRIEQEINEWFQENPPPKEIIQILQSESKSSGGSNLTISVFYYPAQTSPTE